MTIETLTPPTRAEWLALRKQTVGGSEVAALIGAHPWLTIAELWAAKSGLLEDKPETPAMRRGRHLEEVAVNFLREEQPTWTVHPNVIGQGGQVYRDLDLGLSATPDVFVTDPYRAGLGICEIKSVAYIAFKEGWLTGFSSDGKVNPPLYAIIQAILEAFMTGASWACIAALVVDREIELHLVDVPLHMAILDRLKAEARDFWRAVAEGTPPEYDYARDGTLIDRLYAGETGEVIDLSGRNDIPELVAEDQTLKARIKVDQGRRDEIKNRFKDELKEAASATYNGRVVATRKIIRKKGFEVQPSEYVQITLKPAENEAL